jgi:anti-anti-sigma factor
MKFDIQDEGSYRILRCSGTLGSIREESGEMLHPLIEDGQSRILVDLSGVDRITTEAISVFVTLVSRANAKGSRVVFVNPSPFVRAIFSATKITKFLETEDTIEKGLERLFADTE